MSHDSAAMPDQLAPIAAIVDSFRGARTDLDQFVNELLNCIENEQRLGVEQQTQFAADRGQLEQRIAELEQSIEQHKASQSTTADRESELADLRGMVMQLENASIKQVESIRELTTQRDGLQASRDEVHAEAATLKEQISLASKSSDSDSATRVDALTQQNEELQTELEAVRDRAVDLNERLRDTQHKTDVERAEWAAELRQMRKLLEQQSVASTRVPEGTPMVAMPAAQQSPVDAVLTNVMAQFELVQQDVQRHRSAG